MKYPIKHWGLRRPGIILVFFLALFSPVLAQDHTTDARSISLGGCYSTSLSQGSLLYNEAIPGLPSSIEFSASHVRPFILKDLGISSVNIRFPLYPGYLNNGIQHYGIPGFRQLNAALGYGMKLSENIYAGLGFRYYNSFTQGDPGNYWSLGLSGGILVHTGESSCLAVHLVNPFTINNYPGYGPLFPALLTVGLEKEIYDATVMYAEITYDSDRGITLRTAASWQYQDNIGFRIGYHSNPASLSFGSGIHFSNIMMDIAFSCLSDIGITPAITIKYHRGK